MRLTETAWGGNSLQFSSDNRERFPGLHISQISRSLCEARGINKNPSNMTPEQVDEYAAVGFLEEGFSRMLMESLADKPCIVQPPVVAYDGVRGLLLERGDVVPTGYVIGTPDWLWINDEVILEDCKATYKSRGGAATPETWVRKNRWDWEVTTQFYAHALRACGIAVERIRFRLLFLAGDYRPVKPMRKLWTSDVLRDDDLEANWQMIWQHAKENGWL